MEQKLRTVAEILGIDLNAAIAVCVSVHHHRLTKQGAGTRERQVGLPKGGEDHLRQGRALALPKRQRTQRAAVAPPRARHLGAALPS